MITAQSSFLSWTLPASAITHKLCSMISMNSMLRNSISQLVNCNWTRTNHRITGRRFWIPLTLICALVHPCLIILWRSAPKRSLIKSQWMRREALRNQRLRGSLIVCNPQRLPKLVTASWKDTRKDERRSLTTSLLRGQSSEALANTTDSNTWRSMCTGRDRKSIRSRRLQFLN